MFSSREANIAPYVRARLQRGRYSHCSAASSSSPGRQKTPTGGASASQAPSLPSSHCLGAHTAATAQRLPKGKAGRNTRKRSSLCGVIVLNIYFQLLRSKGALLCLGWRSQRAAPPFLRGIQHHFYAKMLPDAQHHTCLLWLPPAFPTTWHTDSHAPLTPSPPAPRRLPQTLLSGALWPRGCHRPCSASTGTAARQWSLSPGQLPPRPRAGLPGHSGSLPGASPRPQPARPGASAVRATAALGGAAAGR